MKVEKLLQQLNYLIGQVVDLEGYLLVTHENDIYHVALSDTDTLDDSYIFIEQPLSEIRKIIQPMHTMILSRRGDMTNAPYLYNFPLQLSARVAIADDDKPTLHDIESARLNVDHPSNMAEWVDEKQYVYSAVVEYGVSDDPINNQPIKAKIMSQRDICFVNHDEESQVLDADANIYARRITQKTITIPGFFKYMPGIEDAPHQFVLRTFSVRASMMGVGPLRGMTSIWWRHNPRYKLVRSHMFLSDDVPDTNRRVVITGQIDYIGDEVVPITGEAQPNLAFSRVDAITIYREDYLLDAPSESEAPE